MLMRFLGLLFSSTMLQSCTSLPATTLEPEQVAVALSLQRVFDYRSELSGQRVTIEGYLFSGENSALLKRADEERPRIGEGRDSCPRNSEADLLILESSLMSGLHRTPGQPDWVLPRGRATSEFRRADQHRVIVSGVLQAERTDFYLDGRHLSFIVENNGRLEDARLERVYEDRCRGNPPEN